MPSFIVKPKKDEDFYVLWSTIVDNWTECGTRKDFSNQKSERLDRADKNGTSMIDADWFGWDDKEFIVYNLPGDMENSHGDEYASIARENLREYCENYEDLEVVERLLVWKPYE